MSKNRGGGRGKAPSNIEGIKQPKKTIAYMEEQIARFEATLLLLETGSTQWCEQLKRIEKKKKQLRKAWKYTPKNLRTKLDENGKIVARVEEVEEVRHLVEKQEQAEELPISPTFSITRGAGGFITGMEILTVDGKPVAEVEGK